jgi:hypothetical protein
LFPLGAPGDIPPCIRHRPLRIAGDRHELPRRVGAPQRGLRCIDNLLCIGLISWERPTPRPLMWPRRPIASELAGRRSCARPTRSATAPTRVDDTGAAHATSRRGPSSRAADAGNSPKRPARALAS